MRQRTISVATNPDRRKLLEDCTTELLEWMLIGDNTHPDIIWWVEQYILGGLGKTVLKDIPETIQEVVESLGDCLEKFHGRLSQ